jgi:hypothetical protein
VKDEQEQGEGQAIDTVAETERQMRRSRGGGAEEEQRRRERTRRGGGREDNGHNTATTQLTRLHPITLSSSAWKDGKRCREGNRARKLNQSRLGPRRRGEGEEKEGGTRSEINTSINTIDTTTPNE